MNASTPAKLIPPDQSTAASGTLPTEQTKLRTATSGPTMTFSIAWTGSGASSMKRALKKSSPSRPMKPANRKPRVISFQSIRQSRTKKRPTSPQASVEPRRRRQANDAAALLGSAPPSFWALTLARASSRGDTKSRSVAAISAIITRPPTNSATVNCQPSKTHNTRPSSQTRLVEANWKASAPAAEAPLAKSERAMAIAA